MINIFSDFAGPNTEFFVVTNQPAVGRGLATKNQVDLLNSEILLDDVRKKAPNPPTIRNQFEIGKSKSKAPATSLNTNPDETIKISIT